MTNIIFITGPAGSGKTTISRLVAAYFIKSLHLQVDRIREMMVSGVELPDHDWTDETTRQFRLARSTATYMAKLYASEGVEVVVDDVCAPAEFADHYTSLFNDPAVHRVLLIPPTTTIIERLRKRAGPYDKLLVETAPWFYYYLEMMPKTGWIVLDSSDWTIEQTAHEVLRLVGALPSEF